MKKKKYRCKKHLALDINLSPPLTVYLLPPLYIITDIILLNSITFIYYITDYTLLLVHIFLWKEKTQLFG